jgi:hypothetical protein
VIASDKEGQHGSYPLSGIVLMEIAEFAVFGRTGHDLEVGEVTHSLKVAAYY